MIKVPDFFSEVLNQKPQLAQAVRKTFDLFEPWLEQSGMPFFPGFTDHSPRHINDVLKTAASLVSDSSRELISSEDVAVLSLAVLLHDCGMHLTQDGFRVLTALDKPPLIPALDQFSWLHLWNGFLSEAQRFGQDKLIAVFGSADPIQFDQIDMDNLSERDCLLVGEFVRRNHTRLAHEIALAGVPSKASNVLKLEGFDDDVRDLAGLVARSHGMSIRHTFPYIQARYSLLPEYRRIKTPYLMAVLRIADYVQVQSERAIQALLSVKELRSPVSRQEWRAHFAVKDVSTRHDDPEALYVHAAPTDVRTFLKLELLFKDIQRELDESWATIGEVYGRHIDLVGLGLSTRRIRSNLDYREKFASTVTYIPVKAGFEASGAGLLKLLVGPLYNYEHKIGVRELIQNAVDACRELSDLRANMRETDRKQVPGTVVLEINEFEDGTGSIVVMDTGVGMTLQTVLEYFLTAGASFRNSDVWKNQHTNDSGESRVMRGGRFGVGVLAAFLLGEEITVRTRHVMAPDSEGLEFVARIDDPTVELRRCAVPVGTSICVRVTDTRVLNELRPSWNDYSSEGNSLVSWDDVDWFAQSNPGVSYRWVGYKERFSLEHESARTKVNVLFISSSGLVPSPEDTDLDWHRLIDSAPYRAILWQYPKPEAEERQGVVYEVGEGSEITVNGIRVQQVSHDYSSRRVKVPDEATLTSPVFQIVRPSLAIFDPQGICPINLQRSAVSFDRMDIDGRLTEAILRDHLETFAGRIVAGKSSLSFDELISNYNYPGIGYEGQLSPLCVTANGCFLAAPCFFAELGIHTVFFLSDSAQESEVAVVDALKNGEAVMRRSGIRGIQADLAWFRGVLAGKQADDWYSRNVGCPLLDREEAASLISPKAWRTAMESGKVARFITDRLGSSNLKRLGKVVHTQGAKVESLRQRLQQLHLALGKPSEIAVWKLAEEQKYAGARPLLAKMWTEVFGSIYCQTTKSNKRKTVTRPRSA